MRFEEAKCREVPTEMFFRKNTFYAAVGVCLQCPLVNTECLDEVKTLPYAEAPGVWAGLMPGKVKEVSRRHRDGETLTLDEVDEMRHGISNRYAGSCHCPLCDPKARWKAHHKIS